MSQASRTTSVILVSHGGAGAAMLEAAERVVGAIDKVAAVAVVQGEPPADVEKRIEAAVAKVGSDGGVVFLVDLGGSTPFNLCCRACGGTSAVVTGMNMPMLFKLSTADRARGPRSLADELASTGTKSIQVRAT
jgi:mannose/fructose-specific phosphotransferase system component IIA